MSITLILGPMFSGKTTEMLRLVRLNKLIGKKCFVINHSFDNRYGNGNKVVTHDGIETDSYNTDELVPLLRNNELIKSDIIAINEGQFFLDLTYFSEKCREMGKDIIICALRGDSNNDMFRSIISIFPKADKVSILTAKCLFCKDGTDAPFTSCNVEKSDQILIGGADKYSSVCYRHYLQLNPI